MPPEHALVPEDGSDPAAQVVVADVAHPALSAEDAFHLARTLRLRDGELVWVTDGRGARVACRYRTGPGRPGEARGPGHARGSGLEVDGEPEFVPRPAPALTVAFVPVKGDRPEWVVQKLTELGIDRIVVLHSRRSVVRWEGDRAARALQRLRRVAREAVCQSRQAWIPEITGVLDLEGLATLGGPVALAQHGGEPPSLALPTVAVGPEGGWAPEELGTGLPLVGLGSSTLRAETATLFVGSMLCAFRGQIASECVQRGVARHKNACIHYSE